MHQHDLSRRRFQRAAYGLRARLSAGHNADAGAEQRADAPLFRRIRGDDHLVRKGKERARGAFQNRAAVRQQVKNFIFGKSRAAALARRRDHDGNPHYTSFFSTTFKFFFFPEPPFLPLKILSRKR